jgi:PAS domain S-box-containing protein
LIADEHPERRQFLTRLLSEHYEVHTAADASTALTLARERAPDLVVADVMMRASDDFNLLRERRRDAWGKIPIIFYSTTSDEDSSVNVAEIGASDDLVLPFSERPLLALIRARLRMAEMRQESIQSLRLSEERIRTLQTMLNPGVWVAGPNGEIIGEWVWWWQKQTGQTPEEYAGFGWQDVAHPADKRHALEIWRRALRNKTPYQIEFRVRQRDGSYRYMRAQGAPVRDADGKVREWIGTIFDIDDQTRAEEALRLSEERHRTFVAMTAVTFWIKAPNGVIVTDPCGWTNLTGQTPNQLRGWGWLEAVHPDDKPRVLEYWQRTLRGAGTTADLEFRVRRKDGTYAYVRDQGVLIRNPDGSAREWVGAITDVDDKRRAEEALRASEEELRANFKMSGVGQVQTDPKTGRYVRVNNRFCEMVGYSEEELLTMTYLDITHPDDRKAGTDLLLDMLRDETTNYTTDERYVRKDGSILWVLITSTLLHDAHHRPLRTITMIEDVTERKQSEALSICQKKALEMIAKGDSLSEVLKFVTLAVEKQTTVDLRSSIQLFDDAGKHLRLCVAPSMPESFHQAVVSFFANSMDAPSASTAFLKQPVIVSDLVGAPGWADIADVLTPYAIRALWAMPIFSSDEKTLGSFCLYSSKPRIPSAAQQKMLENVTHTLALAIEHKQVEAERENLLIREQAANRLKDEFLAVVSHELRTPLNAINGWAHMLLSGTMDAAAQVQALQSIRRQVRSQNELINDLLDVARITSGKLRLELREVDPAKVIAAALDVVSPAAEAKQIALVAEFDRSVTMLSADPNRLQQVIWNLLSNAIKFTPKGGRVEIRLGRTDSNIEIVVADTGQGITEDFLPYVFERFRQADVSTTRTHGGLGLGLAIVRHLVELHGGMVFAESLGKGKGATFTIRLPVRAIHTSSAKSAARKQEAEEPREITFEDRDLLKGRKVLIVEDNSEDREVLSAELTHQGANVRASASAAEALTELEHFRPDVLVADIGLPGEDGYSLIRKIRACSVEHGGLTPAIALTAYAGGADRQRAFEAGYQKHVAKPADPIELARTICHLASKRTCDAIAGTISTFDHRFGRF